MGLSLKHQVYIEAGLELRWRQRHWFLRRKTKHLLQFARLQKRSFARLLLCSVRAFLSTLGRYQIFGMLIFNFPAHIS